MVLDKISQKLLKTANYRKIVPGDVIRIQYVNKLGFWKSKRFNGICIKLASKGNSKNFVLRNVVSNIPVEVLFFYHSNLLIGFQNLPIRKFKKLKRSKLYFIRNLKLNRSKV